MCVRIHGYRQRIGRLHALKPNVDWKVHIFSFIAIRIVLAMSHAAVSVLGYVVSSADWTVFMAFSVAMNVEGSASLSPLYVR